MGVGRQAREIGRRVRTLREGASLTVEQLAQQAGVEPAAIEAIERGDQTPSVAMLLGLARAMSVAPGRLFGQGSLRRRIEVVRAGERWRVERSSSEAGTSLSYSYEALSYRLTEKTMQPFFVEVRLGLEEKVPPSQHEGEEFMYVLDGELELEIEGEKLRLEPGDSVYFDSRLPHVLRAASARPVQLIVVVGTAWAAPTSPTLTRAF